LGGAGAEVAIEETADLTACIIDIDGGASVPARINASTISRSQSKPRGSLQATP
jgi:hypothetical protein